MRVKRKIPHEYIFLILYLTGFFGAGVLGLLSISFFAHGIINALWANILYLLFVSLLYVTAFVQELCKSRKPKDIITDFAIFIGSLIFFLLFYFLGGIFVLTAIIYSAVVFVYIVILNVLKLRNGEEAEPVVSKIIASVSLLLFAMIKMFSVEFVNEKYMLWSLIPAAVIFIIAVTTACILLKEKFKAELSYGKWRFTGNALVCSLIIFFLSFAYSYTTVGTVNCVFDGKPSQIECVVADKKIFSGRGQATQLEIKVTIDEKERWLNVPSDDYYNLEKGDVILINYYNGALGFAYYIYYGFPD